MNLRSLRLGTLRFVGLAAACAAAASCNTLDTTRVPGPDATLGDDIYGVFCDRVGASSLPEDLGGASYGRICHYDARGTYLDTVDESVLPQPVTDAEKAARALSIAKLTRMAQRRGDLVHAINAVFPDTKIQDITSSDPSAQIRLHDALFSLAQTLTPLYTDNPFDTSKGATPLMPEQTQAMARMFGSFGAPGVCATGGAACTWDADCGSGGACQHPARDALSHIFGRRGYRPSPVGLGVVRPALAYPALRKLTTSTLSVLGPGGTASPELQQLLTVTQQELLTAQTTVSPLPDYTVTAATAQPSRPRQDVEFLSALFLTQNDAFAGGAPPRYIALRDRRGLVVPAQSQPGVPGTVMSPFVDLDHDGYADVDAFDRFVDASGNALPLDPPFAIPGETMGTVDAFDRPASSSASYTYLDTSKTLVGGLTPHLSNLLDPTVLAAGDPNAWQKEHETLMYAMAGATVLLGDRQPATYDYLQEGPGGQKVSYTRFDGDTSPIPDLVHALGQVLADQDSDALLQSLLDLLQNHEQVVARLMGAALQIRQISLQHDAAAAAGMEPAAGLAYTVTLWDEMAAIVAQIVQHPGLLQGLLAAMADPTAVMPLGNASGMGDAMSRFAQFKDAVSYNQLGTHYDGSSHDSNGGINGPTVNLTVDPNGGAVDVDPRTPVDRTMPLAGTNRSCLQRSLQLIHDADGGPACNKQGAVVEAKIGPFSAPWPLIGSYNECELFQFDNLAQFYLDSLLPASHPKRSQLVIKSATLNDILGIISGFGGDPNQTFEASSDIAGLTLHPEPSALNRLVFFGAASTTFPSIPDLDLLNTGTITDNFVSNTIEPVSSAWCTPDANNVPTCPDQASTMRLRDANSIFLWERFGFSQYLGPMTQAFANAACNPSDASQTICGESIFIQLFELLNKHWPGPDHGDECVSTDKSSPIYCSAAALNRYEPILADTFETDIIPALHEFAKVALELSKITVARGPNKGQTRTGADVLEEMTKILFDPTYAASVHMVNRAGKASTTWVDGTPQPQLTVYSLVADALHEMDTRFAASTLPDAAARQGQWKRARSQLVDEFLAVDGTGTSAQFHNPTIAPTLIATLQLAREQVNARCPNRENGTPCTWAKKDLGDELSGVISRPLFAAIMDVQDKVRQGDGARRQLETFLQYALSSTTDGGTSLQAMLASTADILQVLADDGDLTPILAASRAGAAPDADPAGPGAGSVVIKVLKALTEDQYDRYHVMDHVLPNLVTPMSDGTGLSPIEIFMDVIADIDRIDASTVLGQKPGVCTAVNPASPVCAMAHDDYQGVMSSMQVFMTDKTRGLTQLYTIIQRRQQQ